MSALLAGMTATTFAAKSFVAAPSLSSPTNPTVFARFTIIAERRRAFEPTLPLFQFFYRRGSVVEGVGRRARQLGRFAFMLNDARVHSALNLLQKWKCIPGVREHIYALVNCPVDLLCSPRCESRAACEAKRKQLLHDDRFRAQDDMALIGSALNPDIKRQDILVRIRVHFGDEIFVRFVFHRSTTPLSFTSA